MEGGGCVCVCEGGGVRGPGGTMEGGEVVSNFFYLFIITNPGN